MTRLPHRLRLAALAATLSALPAAAGALTFENRQGEPARIIIEKWVQIINDGSDALFTPSSDPAAFRIEFRHFLVLCEAPADARVTLKDDGCYVNGELAAEGQFRM